MITRPSTSHSNNVPVRGEKTSRCIASYLNQKFLLHVKYLVTLSGSKIGHSLQYQCYKNDVPMMERHWQKRIVLVPVCQTQIPHWLSWDRIQVSSVTG